MEKRTLVYGREPVWVTEDRTALNLIVSFAELNGEMLFTATSYDDLPHGRDIFARACAGEFGEVAAYVPPTTEQLSATLRYQRDMLLKDCDWTQLPDIPQSIKDVWAIYRQQLRDVPLQTNFPYQVEWPVPPT